VQLGDTLASIARKLGVSAAAILQANNISNPDLIWVGQKLLIPGAEGSPPSTPRPGAAASSVPSMPGAVAPAIASTATPTPEPTVVALSTPTIHVVAAGETLSQIAKRYGVSVEALVSTNGLGSPDMIRVGMKLIIPKEGTSTATGPLVRPTKFVASISQQRCWLYAGETVIARWICSTGRSGSVTRPGEYKIQSKMPKAYGSTWNIWMPFWLGIYWAGGSENGIHGLPWDAQTGVQIWSGNVGKPITFGCVMLDNVNAKTLYDMAWIGMPVIIRP
jgi:LysM repeat protein